MEFEKAADVAVMRFAAARAREIASLTDVIANPSNTKLIFQKLPCHMRRRAMSHNPNRMPRMLREAHKKQMEKGGPISQPKRPRRKYRRRPSRLLEEYSRRSRSNTWLETHIWHAKRFHMATKWGYQLPAQSCDRSFRFCYRSTAHYCMAMDISYMSCLEITGPQGAILNGLKELTNPALGLTFGSVSLLKGNHEGRIVLYPKDRYPNDPIGLVTFLWRYGEVDPEKRTLWIWSHPAFYQQILSELCSAFELNTELLNTNSGIRVTLNRDKLNRFRLRGPLTFSVLSSILNSEIQGKMANGKLIPGFIIGNTSRDPRVTLPTKRCQPETCGNENASSSVEPVDLELSRSCVWDAAAREQISELRKLVPDRVINERRQKLLVPGTELPREADECAIPLLIINAPNEGQRYIPGCDIILPAGWATAFWLSIIYNGGRAGGLFDAQRMYFEYGICRDLQLEVDSQAGETASSERRMELADTYFGKPPKTRINYIKLATPFPFSVDWNQLIADWNSEKIDKPFYVLRDRGLVRSLAAGSPTPDAIKTEPCLVSVNLNIKHGCPQEFAMICLPNEQDKPTKECAIVEPVHKDPAAKERKALRLQHRADLKKLAKKRKDSANDKEKKENQSESLVDDYNKKMRQLWMPGQCNLRTSFARPVIGFAIYGDYGLSSGKGSAKGFLVAHTLSLLRNKNVLVRNPGTDHYMWAELTNVG